MRRNPGGIGSDARRPEARRRVENDRVGNFISDAMPIPPCTVVRFNVPRQDPASGSGKGAVTRGEPAGIPRRIPQRARMPGISLRRAGARGAKPPGRVPNVVPIVPEQIAQRLVIRLARDYAAVGFNAHVVHRRGAAFHPQFLLHRIEMAIFRRCVPDELLACSGRFFPGRGRARDAILFRKPVPTVAPRPE